MQPTIPQLVPTDTVALDEAAGKAAFETYGESGVHTNPHGYESPRRKKWTLGFERAAGRESPSETTLRYPMTIRHGQKQGVSMGSGATGVTLKFFTSLVNSIVPGGGITIKRLRAKAPKDVRGTGHRHSKRVAGQQH
jgi:hypothetical protein